MPAKYINRFNLTPQAPVPQNVPWPPGSQPRKQIPQDWPTKSPAQIPWQAPKTPGLPSWWGPYAPGPGGQETDWPYGGPQNEWWRNPSASFLKGGGVAGERPFLKGGGAVSELAPPLEGGGASVFNLPDVAGGGGGEGGGGDSEFPTIPDPAGSQSQYVWDYIKNILEGNNLPFGPKEIDIQKGQAKSASENTFAQAKDLLDARAASTGFASSPAANRQLLEARIGASQQYGKASSQIAIEAATQNFNAKMAALTDAQRWIDSLRSYVSQMTTSLWDKQARMAELDLAKERLRQEMENERAKIIILGGGGA